jgi:hypothetical protein
MLKQAINNVVSIAQRAASVTGGGGPVTVCAAHAKQFESSEVPELVSFQSNLSSFSSSALASVTNMISKLEGDTSPKDLASTLTQLKTALEPVSDEADSISAHMNSFRTMFSADVASLNQYEATLQGQIVKFSYLQKHYADQAASIQKRLNVINGMSYIPIFGPIVKLGSEVESLIATGKVTEKQLSDAHNQLQTYTAQMQQAQSSVAAAGSLSSQTQQLAVSVEDARNAITLVQGKLSNEQGFIDQTNKTTAKLYLTALKSSFSQLENVAA